MVLLLEIPRQMHVCKFPRKSKTYVTMCEKTDHLAQVSDIETRCSALFTLRNGEVRVVIAHTVLE